MSYQVHSINIIAAANLLRYIDMIIDIDHADNDLLVQSISEFLMISKAGFSIYEYF